MTSDYSDDEEDPNIYSDGEDRTVQQKVSTAGLPVLLPWPPVTMLTIHAVTVPRAAQDAPASVPASAPPMPPGRVLADTTNQQRMTSFLAPGAQYKRQPVQQPLTKYYFPQAPKASQGTNQG